MVSCVLLYPILEVNRAKEAWSVMVFSMGCHVNSYMKGLIMYVSEPGTKKTTMVKEFPIDSEMNVTLTRSFPS